MNQNHKQKKRAVYAGVFASILSVLRIIAISNIIGDEGSGFYAAAYEIYSISFIIASFCFAQTVSKMIAVRLNRGQARNAQKVFISSILLCIVGGILSCLLLEVLANFLTNTFLLQGKSIFALKWLAPTILFVGISGCIRGYFKGIGATVLVAISQISEQIIIWIICIFGTKYFYNYGLKVGTLLKDDSYGAAYGAAGAMIGITAGSLISLLILLILYRSKRSMLHKMIAKDATIKDESYSQVFRVLFISTLPFILSSVLFSLPTLIDQRIFYHGMIGTSGAVTSTLQFGIFYGKFRVFILIAIILSSELQSLVGPTIHKMLTNGEQKLAKDFVKDKMLTNLRLSIPGSVAIAILAELIISLLYKGNVTTAVMLLQRGAILIVLYSVITITIGVLQGAGKQLMVITNLLISLIVHMISLIFMLNYLNMNIEAVVYSWIIFAGLIVILNGFIILKHLRYRQEWKLSVILPVISSGIMGFIMVFIVQLLSDSLGKIGTIIISLLLGIFVYLVSLIALKGINQRELSILPGGRVMIKLAKIIRIM